MLDIPVTGEPNPIRAWEANARGAPHRETPTGSMDLIRTGSDVPE